MTWRQCYLPSDILSVMFLTAVLVIFVISFLWALFSLRKELGRPKEVSLVKEELMKEKVLFVKD